MKQLYHKDKEIIEFLSSSPSVPNAKLESLANREETLFLSLVLRNKDLITDAVESGITQWFFQNEIIKKIYLMAIEYFKDYNGEVMGRPALESMLAAKDSPEEAAMLRSKYDSIVAEFGVGIADYALLKNNLEARYIQRQGYSVCLKGAEELLNATGDQKTVVSKLQNYFNEIAACGGDLSFARTESLSQVSGQVIDDAENRRLHPEKYRGIRSGWAKMDKDFNGFLKGCYMVITATEGGGKTTFMMNLARNFAMNGSNVVYVTIESSNVDIGRRLLTMHARVDHSRIMHGGTDQEHGLSDYIMQDLRVANEGLVSQIGKRIHLIQVLENTHREAICRLIQRVMACNPVDVVIIDYLQVVGKEVNFGDRVDQAIADVSSKFRAWGRKNNVLMITAQQVKSDKGRKLQEKTSDDDEDFRIVRGDTSSSKEITGAADYMFGCWIPRTKDRMVVWNTKNRKGIDDGKYVFTYDRYCGRIEEMGEFGDPDTVADIVADKSRREDIKKQIQESSDIMGSEPPDDIDGSDDGLIGEDRGFAGGDE